MSLSRVSRFAGCGSPFWSRSMPTRSRLRCGIRYQSTHAHTTQKHTAKHAGRERVTVIGSGNWGSVAARIIAQNVLRHPSQYEPEVRMWVYEENIPLTFPELQNAVGTESVNEAALIRTFDKLGGYSLTHTDAKHIIQQYGDKHTHTINLDEIWKWWSSSPAHASHRKLSNIINSRHENVKYLPGINLGSNLIAETNLVRAVDHATTLVFVTPHQFIKGLCEQLKPVVHPSAKAISLIKGMEVTDKGFELISELIRHQLGVDCSVLMGANIASEIALEKFSEATVGYADAANGHLFQQLFHTDYFHVRSVPDVAGTEMCGTLKNIIALGAGFVDGLKLGNNTKAAIIRIGLVEMMKLSKAIFPTVQDSTFLESCGVADLITTCYGGRNRKVAEAFVLAEGKKSFTQLERELLNGQKLQGVLTSYEVQAILKQKGWESQYPLISTIHQICDQKLVPADIVRYADIYKRD